MFDPARFVLSSGAIQEIREAFRHVADETATEVDALKLRLESLESMAEGAVTHAAKAVREETATIYSGMKVEAHHVGMSFAELFTSLSHPFRAGAALKQADGDPDTNPAFASAVAHTPNFPQ